MLGAKFYVYMDVQMYVCGCVFFGSIHASVPTIYMYRKIRILPYACGKTARKGLCMKFSDLTAYKVSLQILKKCKYYCLVWNLTWHLNKIQ